MDDVKTNHFTMKGFPVATRSQGFPTIPFSLHHQYLKISPQTDPLPPELLQPIFLTGPDQFPLEKAGWLHSNSSPTVIIGETALITQPPVEISRSKASCSSSFILYFTGC